MAETNGEDINDSENLSTIFKEGLDNYNNIINSDQPTNSPDIQVKNHNIRYVSPHFL